VIFLTKTFFFHCLEQCVIKTGYGHGFFKHGVS
jgi:hypothetical protein